ncbi:hypothetical protein H4Q32_026205 [Labeo rohita]|uniref:Secreted protein n=1 Tax=Labeo rohita TaxID=84645 RepID=A0ABQ8L4P8_LABRO|nr:hypothetical protein H4Q32_026205 [Labeo rohita]
MVDNSERLFYCLLLSFGLSPRVLNLAACTDLSACATDFDSSRLPRPLCLPLNTLSNTGARSRNGGDSRACSQNGGESPSQVKPQLVSTSQVKLLLLFLSQVMSRLVAQKPRHVSSDTPRSRPSMLASMLDPPLVSVRAASIPVASAPLNLTIKEVLPSAAALPLMAIAICLLQRSHLTASPVPPEVPAYAAEPLEVAASTAASLVAVVPTTVSPEMAAEAAEPHKMGTSVLAPCTVVAPNDPHLTNELPACPVTAMKAVLIHDAGACSALDGSCTSCSTLEGICSTLVGYCSAVFASISRSSTWTWPSNPCLASPLPYGSPGLFFCVECLEAAQRRCLVTSPEHSEVVMMTLPSNVPRTFQDGHDVKFFKDLGDLHRTFRASQDV